ncbi:hypothetical protein Sjap_020371 [Stephania japonica]|uniref:Uncharacterized protein n=1 Tax=Stephania japonica TaxID=461633 RepID=A0AAP0F3C2_9MAGN
MEREKWREIGCIVKLHGKLIFANSIDAMGWISRGLSKHPKTSFSCTDHCIQCIRVSLPGQNGNPQGA